MKKYLLKPSFEVIFSLSLIAVLALPPVLFAQTKKDMDITIINGDTTINGKNIKKLSANDRREALKDINRMNIQPEAGGGNMTYSFKRKDSVDGKPHYYEFRLRKSNRDSIKIDNGNPDRMKKSMTFNYRMDNNEMPGNRMELRERSDMARSNGRPRFDRRNSQNFDYVINDKDGISTHIMYHVSEVSNDDLKKMPHVEGSRFEISDLNLVPEFSTGKTLMMFKLPAKTMAEVKLTDDEGKILWTEKSAGGNFSKTFVLGLNGVYYLQIKQGNNVAVRRIMKEQ